VSGLIMGIIILLFYQNRSYEKMIPLPLTKCQMLSQRVRAKLIKR
jgi:hypothetical protein